MVEEVDLEEGGSFFDLFSDTAIGIAWGGVAGRVIVGENEGVAEVDDDGAEDFTRVGERFIDETARDFLHVNEAQAAVKDEDVEDFLTKVGGEWGKEFVDDFGAVEDGAFQVFSCYAGTEFEGGEELAGFGEAEAVLLGDFRDV